MRKATGFTTIEALVVVAIVAILVAIAAPNFRLFMLNSRIRAYSESTSYALALARADAARLNTRVEYVAMTSGWVVRRTDTAEVLHSGTGKESVQSGLTVTYEPTDARTVTFDAFGRRTTNQDGSQPATQIDITATSESGTGNNTYHPLRVQVLASGLTRLCDPSLASTDSRACL